MAARRWRLGFPRVAVPSLFLPAEYQCLIAVGYVRIQGKMRNDVRMAASWVYPPLGLRFKYETGECGCECMLACAKVASPL